MRFAGTKETGNPDAIGCSIIVVGIQESLKLLLDLIGNNILFKLDLRLASSSALMTSSIARSTGFSKISRSFMMSPLDPIMHYVESSVVFVVVKDAE